MTTTTTTTDGFVCVCVRAQVCVATCWIDLWSFCQVKQGPLKTTRRNHPVWNWTQKLQDLFILGL